MNKLLVLLLLLFSASLHAQKIKVKKGIASVDGAERYIIEKKKTLSSSDFVVSDMHKNPILRAETKRQSAYWSGPYIDYFNITNLNGKDSCIMSYFECSSPKKLISVIEKYQLIKANKFSKDGMDELIREHDQDIVEQFMSKHELSYDVLVKRASNSEISFAGPTDDKYEFNKKYGVYATEITESNAMGLSKIGIGYVMVEEGENGLRYFNYYLPNGLIVAEVKAQENGRITGFKSISDGIDHKRISVANIKGLTTIAQD